MVTLWWRAGRGMPWLAFETFDTAGEAERLGRRSAAAGEYVVSAARPKPDAAPLFTIKPKPAGKPTPRPGIRLCRVPDEAR